MGLVLGIDPGYNGALSLLETEHRMLTVIDMPVGKEKNGRTVLDLYKLAELIDPNGSRMEAVLEQVAARPGQGAPATFRFGQGYGAIQMALAAFKVPVHYVTPATWKKHFKLSKEKGVSRSYVQDRFPQHAGLFARAKDDGRAESTLIALYGEEKLNLGRH